MAHSHTDETDLIREIALTRRHLRDMPRHPGSGGVVLAAFCVCVAVLTVLVLVA